MISFILPAHDEEELIGRALSAVHDSARALGEPYEVVVASDSSTDRTCEIAREPGARVVEVGRLQISATRNAGAMAATGDIFIFVDADTMVTEPAVRAAVRALREGAIGGGCAVRFDGSVPFHGKIIEYALPVICRTVGMAAGCFLFCTRDAYFAAGGFDEDLYVTEEVAFGQRLKLGGRFVILRESVITSGRKLRTHSALDLVRIGVMLLCDGPKFIRRREGLDYWYGPRQPRQ